jgi:hypothetical protein
MRIGSGSSYAYSSCACICHQPDWTETCPCKEASAAGTKKGRKPKKRKKGASTAPVANRWITDPAVRECYGLLLAAERTCPNCLTKFTKWQAATAPGGANTHIAGYRITPVLVFWT